MKNMSDGWKDYVVWCPIFTYLTKYRAYLKITYKETTSDQIRIRQTYIVKSCILCESTLLTYAMQTIDDFLASFCYIMKSVYKSFV